MQLTTIIIVFFVVLVRGVSETSASFTTRASQWLEQAVLKSIDNVNNNSCGSEEKHPCGGRDFSNMALAIYLTNPENVSGAMYWLRKVRPGASFVGLTFCALLHEEKFMNSLNTSDRRWVINAVNEALPSLAKPSSVDVSYSNIYFMGMVNRVLCGEAPGVDPNLGSKSAARGYLLKNDWLQYANDGGNHEFSSPTYAWVQLNALTVACIYAKECADFCQILDHLWANIAANFLRPPSSYQVLTVETTIFCLGTEPFKFIPTYLGGLGTHAPVCEYKDAHCERTNDGQNALVLLNIRHILSGKGRSYVPNLDILNLSKVQKREVRSRWIGQNKTANNESFWQGDRYNYIVSGKYSIGSASSDYITNTHVPYYPCPQDKMVNINLASSKMTQEKPIPSISVVPDYADNPYGHWYEPLTDKPSHLATHPGNVQFKNVLLSTSAINPTEQLDGFSVTNFSSLATNIILPSSVYLWDSKIYVDGHFIDVPNKPFQYNVSSKGIIALRVDESCAVIKILEVDGCEGQPPRAILKIDATGNDLGAMRLAMYHYRGRVTKIKGQTHVRAALLFLVDECQDENEMNKMIDEVDSAPVSSDIRDGTWNVTSSLRGTIFTVLRDVREPHCLRWSCLLERYVNGTIVDPVPLQVNGVPKVPLPRLYN